jgi:hypothetical protein
MKRICMTFFKIFMNFVSSCTQYVYSERLCTRYIPLENTCEERGYVYLCILSPEMQNAFVFA